MKNNYLVVGLGMTGLSCVRFLKNKGFDVTVMDSREHPPGEIELRREWSDVELYTGPFSELLIEQAQEIVLSPGVPLAEPCFQRALTRGQSVIGDIELFCREVKAPIIAITGSNAKSTVTDLMATVIRDAGFSVIMGGNIGIPALDLLRQPVPDYYVIELSSFQLETTYSLAARVACILNISPDHMDRYDSLAAYQQSKQRIYKNCQFAVFNSEDELTAPPKEIPQAAFSIQSLIQNLRLVGRHNQLNAAAVFAMGQAINLPVDSMLRTFERYEGLPHRCQSIGELNGVVWYDDSKGTNVGATQAALEGFGAAIRGGVILIAGGVGKDADFSGLRNPVQRYAKQVILIGQDARVIAACLPEDQVFYAKDLTDAVKQAHLVAQPGDVVLLSPACASFDMFKNFAHRGKMFQQAFAALKKKLSYEKK